ncbi:hypothetical protein O6471_24620, partial [Salmonella enterica subsp. enterica]
KAVSSRTASPTAGTKVSMFTSAVNRRPCIGAPPARATSVWPGNNCPLGGSPDTRNSTACPST